MATRLKRPSALPLLPFSQKLVLNQWLISLFGIDPLQPYLDKGRQVRPLYALTKTLLDCHEGLDSDNLHFFYQQLKVGWLPNATLHPDSLLAYEQNIVNHTQWLNEGRVRPIEWKYYQWLSLLFTEIYLDQYFNHRENLLANLNEFINKFNAYWASQRIPQATGIEPYTLDELNKLCLQNATGSGKTLLMNVNYRQFAHYAKESGQANNVTRTLLITPNEALSQQHELEMRQSGIEVGRLVLDNNDMYATESGQLARIDFIEITKLGDKDGPTSIATRNLGQQNLILVDEGHRGMGKAEEDGWYKQRTMLTEKGFAFEYSATFREAVSAAANPRIEQAYAKAVLFDYSYKYFYEDGYGKDYRIFNIPKSQDDLEFLYLTGCLLSFYQQLSLYSEFKAEYSSFNIEKPLWVFVGGSVSKAVTSKKIKGQLVNELDETASDVVQVLRFFANFLADTAKAKSAINTLLTKKGDVTGLISNNVDIFHGAFLYLLKKMQKGKSIEDIHLDILDKLFNNPAGGLLQVLRLKGDSGELVLQSGEGNKHFGLINVGDALGLSKHLEALQASNNLPPMLVGDSDFLTAQFNSVKDSSSPINLLMGAKKFVEGWDCWRVSTLGLMRVGRTEGSQIIQLFGRGVRLKGWQWSLKRSSKYAGLNNLPQFIQLIETLNVFGVQADFMEKFRQFLQDEGLPTNDSKEVFTIPMNVTHDFGHKLKIIRPKIKDGAGREYSFNRDGVMPVLGEVPDYLIRNNIEVDWYPKITAISAPGLNQMKGAVIEKNVTKFSSLHVAFINIDKLYFELEKYKARENQYSLTIRSNLLAPLLLDTSWYKLLVPEDLMSLTRYSNVNVWNQLALELLKKYCKKFFEYKRDEFIRPRLRVAELSSEYENLPKNGENYILTVDASETQLIADIHKLQNDIEAAHKSKNKRQLLDAGQLKACILGNHLYQPLLSAKRGTSISISPVALNESETDFVTALMKWLEQSESSLTSSNTSIYLLRNKSRGSGIGFFEAGNFYPDFILWTVNGPKQTVAFIEPHGISHEGPQHPKIQFHKTIKDIENRLGDKDLRLESAIVTPTLFSSVKDRGLTVEEWEAEHVFFMAECDSLGTPSFISKIMELILCK